MSYKIENRTQPFTAHRIKKLLPLPHIHRHLELVYITSGTTTAVADQGTYTLQSGDLFLSFPNQIHYYEHSEPVEGHLIIFTPEFFGDLSKMFQSKLATSSVLRSTELPSHTKDTLESIFTKMNSKVPLDIVIAKGLCQALLGEILSLMKLIDKPGETDSIKRILTYCAENYTRPLTLDMLSKDLYLSKFYISHIFRERMNYGFNDYINYLRVEHACTLLKSGISVTECAYASGFSTVRTFNNAFMKHRALSPREYKKSQK